MDEDEVDLRPYISTLIDKKWWIIGFVLLLTIVVLFITLLTPEIYTANSTLLLTRSRSTLSLADQFLTVNEPVDTRSRMDALISIAASDLIADKTLQSLNKAIPEDYRSIDNLKKVVSVKEYGDSIKISVSTTDPKLSAELANTWANNLVETINLAYSGEQPLSNILEKLTTAKTEYSTAQAELEDFIKQNPKKELETRLNESNSVLATYGSDRSVQMAYYLDRKLAMEELEQQATALKTQLEGGNRSTAGNIGDALSVILARMDAILSRTINVNNLASTGDTSPQQNPIIFPQQNATINLQIDGNFPEDGSAGFSGDIEGIIDLAQEERTKAEQKIEELAHEINNPDPGRLDTISSAALEIQDLERQIEVARAEELELTSNRDLAWEVYQALAQKETELKNSILTSNQVTLASSAVIPNKPDPRGIVRNTVIAGFVGIVLGAIGVISVFWWRRFNLSNANE